MRRSIFTYLCIFLSIPLFSQMPEPKQTVFIFVEDSMFAMRTIDSQTEIKKGWDIQGINVGRKIKRYFYGENAKQVTDQKPTFAIYPTKQNLNDYVLVRLNERRGYRYLPKSEIRDCDYIRIELGHFSIENLPEMGFAVTPLKPLFPGEYILVDITQEPTNKYGDFKAYDFSVEEE